MRGTSLKWIIATIIILVIIFAGVFVFLKKVSKQIPVLVPVETPAFKQEVIGKSVAGRNIEAYIFGNGQTQLAFVGGIHGGYEWNSVLLAYKFVDYLKAYPEIIPKNITVTIIPAANPDGIFAVTGKEGRFTSLDVPANQVNGTGRFNNNKVDLNRNFACNWQATSTWKNNIVSAGTAAFSEPEALAIKNFVTKNNPSAMIFWHSQSNAVYASQCNNGILAGTRNIMNLYSKAAGYPAVDVFDSYAITGAVEDWLASINIPAITVELQTHESIEWEKNLAGVKAIFGYYSTKVN
jgi:predicted deacylase